MDFYNATDDRCESVEKEGSSTRRGEFEFELLKKEKEAQR
jgi:hypothetical protein